LEQNRNNLKKRLEVYEELTKRDDLGRDLRLDVDNCEAIIRFMDAVVIKLEGGLDEDVAVMMRDPISDESIDEYQKKHVVGAGGFVLKIK
jgi:hypothetical protein